MPRRRSTAEIIAPARPYFSRKGASDGFFPPLHGQIPVAGGFSLLQATPVNRVAGKDLLRPLDTVEEDLGIAAAWEVVFDGLADDIVGRGGLSPKRPGNDHQVPVADPWVDPDIPERGVQVAEEFGTLGAGYVPGVEVLHHPVPDRDQVAPVGDLPVLEADPHAGSLQGAPPGIGGAGVISQDGEVCDIAPGLELVRNGPEHSAPPLPGDPVHVWYLCVLEGCSTPQFGKRLISHAVSEDDDVFHVNL
jgi:hypothetical protein